MAAPIAKLRKRRGVVRASITRLGTRLKELEDAADRPDTPQHAGQLAAKLRSLDGEFDTIHFDVIDLIDEENEDVLVAEQGILDRHDNDAATLTVRLGSLSTAPVPSLPDVRKSLSEDVTPAEWFGNDPRICARLISRTTCDIAMSRRGC